jgi:molybdenum cofactor cytidylyltransferase
MVSRYFALIPAAGHSVRMGQPKLLLPLGGRPLVMHTLAAWRRSGIDRVVVVVRPGDNDLAAAAREAGEFKVQGSKFKVAVDVVIPEVPPPDMKASLQAALKHIERESQPNAADAFLVAPADMPRLSPRIIDRLMERHSAGSKTEIVVPTIGGKRGHPVLFPWPLTVEVFQLASDEGLNAIVDRRPKAFVPCDDLVAAGETPFADVDTPQQLRQMNNDE